MRRSALAFDASAPRNVPPGDCGSYYPGHDVHPMTAVRGDRGGPRTIRAVAHDGTITFTDGSTVWNHDPCRLRVILDRCGYEVRLGSQGLLTVPHGRMSEYCFSVSDEPDPCRPETAEDRPGESMFDELHRRGGFLRSGRSALNELRTER
jgi:hypothetical protein